MTSVQLAPILILNRISQFNAKSILPFIETYGSIEALTTPSVLAEISKMGIAGKRLSERIAYEKNEFDVQRELRLIEHHNVAIIGFQDKGYPRLLKQISQPPLVLYVRGNSINDVAPCLSIVGSRNASFYGLETAHYFGYECALRGITITSGFARGIDSAAHDGALKASGTTVGVLGCGIDVLYPRSNKKLYERILEEGSLVSEFSMGTEPFPYNFPRRNRIIAGLSQGVLVVEASERSGSLITARLALEENRDVYSIPGKINYRGAKGSNQLLKQGAKLAESVDDIIEDFECAVNRAPSVDVHLNGVDLNGEEKMVKDYVTSSPCNVEQIIAAVDLSSAHIQTILTQLELKGIVTRETGGYFVVKK